MKIFAGDLMGFSRKLSGFVLAIVVVLGMAMYCSNCVAQSGAGSIQGTVRDTTGAVIPNASVIVTLTTTNATFSTKSNEVGYYDVPGLFTGTYKVTISAPGMKTYETSIELLVAQHAVIDPTMTAGAVTQEVEVEASTVQLTTTDSGTLAATLENQRINQLPMNGRELLTLVGMTTPGVEGGGQRVNGMLAEGLEYIADGVTLTNRQFGGEGGNISNNFSGQSQMPDPDAIQEVQLVTNGSAQYSEPGTVVITTKSGTNSLHGALFETARNNAVGIARARQNPSNFSAPHYVRNEYGVSIGGPIVLPPLYNAKGKSFWFLSYEKYSLASFTYQLVSVPTVAMRQGDFSQLASTAGILQVLYDPATTQSAANNYARTPFPNNQIPAGSISPAGKVFNDITPLPNLPAVTDPLVQGNLEAENFANQFIPTWTFRIDHSFNDKNRAYLRFTSITQDYNRLRNNPANQPATVAADGIPANASGAIDNPDATYAASIEYTHVFSPTFFAETILAQNWFTQFYKGMGNPERDYESMLGLPNNHGEPGLPILGSGSLLMQFGGQQFGYGMNQIVSDIDENLTKIEKNHQIYFGGRYRHERFGYKPQNGQDTISFSALDTGLYDPTSGANYTQKPNTGNANADFYLGAASSYSVGGVAPYSHYHDMEFDTYIQDNYHASRNLTVNLGLRWEAHPAAWTKYGLMNGFDLKNDAMVLASPPSTMIAGSYTTQAIISNMQNIGVVFETPEQAGMPADTLMRNYLLTLSPRVGFAYQLFGHGTVLRGAYGRYIYPVPVRSVLQWHQENAPISVTYSQSYTVASQSPDGLPNYLLRNPQSVIMGANSSNVVNSTSVNAILPGLTNTSNPVSMPPDYVTQVNMTLEQALKGNAVVRISYVWDHSTNLDHYYDYNNHPSTFVWETAYGIVPPTGTTIGSNQYAATATGPYDQTTWGGNALSVKNGWTNDGALQASYERLFHNGIAYQISYVLSNASRIGGNWNQDSVTYPAANFQGVLGSAGSWSSPYGTVAGLAPIPAPPAGTLPWQEYHALDKFEQYLKDTAIPNQHIKFNGIVNLPFGRGKKFLGNANRFVDELIGGFQIAGDGNVLSQNFAVTSSNWGSTNPIKVSKHDVKITDCRSGTCLPAYEWFNGYVAPTANANASCTSKCISGLPSSYVPYQTPIDNTPGTANYGTNNVLVTLSNGKTSTVAYSPGPAGANPFSRTVLNGPTNYTVDLSVFKVFPIRESMNLRVNVDAFNALNVQGYNNPSSTDGTENMTSSYNTPRQLQFTLRLQF